MTGLSYLEDGEFAKIYKGQFAATPQGKKLQVVIKAPRVSEQIRKEKSEFYSYFTIFLNMSTSKNFIICLKKRGHILFLLVKKHVTRVLIWVCPPLLLGGVVTVALQDFCKYTGFVAKNA